MFVGRDTLLERLEHSLLSGSGTKCIVMFGQKRAGKSSLLEHLKRRLLNRGDCLPVQFSLYEIGPKLNEPKFFYTILKSIANAILDLKDQGQKLPNLVCPSINESNCTQPSVFLKL